MFSFDRLDARRKPPVYGGFPANSCWFSFRAVGVDAHLGAKSRALRGCASKLACGRRIDPPETSGLWLLPANPCWFSIACRRGGRPCPPAENARFHGNPMRNRNILEGGQSRPPLEASLKGYATQAADRRFQEGKQGRPAHALRYEGESTEWPRRHHCRIASRVNPRCTARCSGGFNIKAVGSRYGNCLCRRRCFRCRWSTPNQKCRRVR